MPIIDAHAYLGTVPESVRAGTYPELESVLRRARVSAAILASAAAEDGDFARGNEQLAGTVADRANVFALCSVNPSYPDESIAELRRRLVHPYFVGVKLPRQAAGERIASEGFRAILTGLRRYGHPVFIDTTSEQDVRDVATLAGEYTTLKFVAGGMGGEHWETAIRALAEVLTVSLDIGHLAADRDKVADAVAAVGPRRVLFASHFPRIHPVFVLGMVRDAAISDSDRDRMLYRNAREVFGLQLAEAALGEPVNPDS